MAPLDYRAWFDASPNPYMVLDGSLRYVAANHAYLTVTGSTLADILGRHVIDAFPHDAAAPDNAPARMLMASFERVLTTRRADVLARIVYSLPMDGSAPRERVWSATHTPLFAPDGSVAFILQHTVDVTAVEPVPTPTDGTNVSSRAWSADVLRRAQLVQEQNESLYTQLRTLRRLLEQAPGFACVLRGPAHVIEVVNRAFHELVGPRELVGRAWRDAFPGPSGQGLLAILDQVYRTNEPFIARGHDVTMRGAADSAQRERTLDFVAQPMIDDSGETLGVFVLGNDLTEQRRLTRAHERLAAIVEQSSDFVAICNASLELDYLNEAGRRLLSILPDQVASTSLASVFDQSGRAHFDAQIVPALRRDRRVEGEMLLRAGEPDADAVPVWCTLFTLRDQDARNPSSTAAVARDIRQQRKQADALARVLRAEQQARAEAERANVLKDDFLATVSHELRTPLSAMIGWLHMLRAGQLPAEHVDRALDVIERNARAQQRLVDDILDVSSIITGKFKLRVESVRVAEVVEAAVDVVRPSAAAKDIRIQLTLDGHSLVMGDPARMQQMVWNLLSNAVKFTPRAGRVHVLLRRLDSAVEITVSDTGQGMSAEFLPHAFERFRQAESGITRQHGGLGLGLSIVKQLVELHGGTVSAASEGKGTGATFVLLLPVAPARSAAPPINPEGMPPGDGPFAHAAGLRGRLILVIDDEPDSRELLAEALRGAGAQVEIAGSASDGLRAFMARTPDLVLSDIGMPGEDGYALIRKIRALPAELGGRVPAVALTALARTEDRKQALLAGFRAHVPKPVDLGELFAVLSALNP